MKKNDFCLALFFLFVGSVMLMLGLSEGWAGIITSFFVAAVAVYRELKD